MHALQLNNQQACMTAKSRGDARGLGLRLNHMLHSEWQKHASASKAAMGPAMIVCLTPEVDTQYGQVPGASTRQAKATGIPLLRAGQ